MTPVHCKVKHDPENGKYGDCLRACIASLLDMDADAVPNFVDDDVSGVECWERVSDFLCPLGFAPFMIAYANDATFDEILETQQITNPHAHYMLFGSCGGTDHVVICQGSKIIHDPAWYTLPMTGPHSSGYYIMVALAKS